MLCILPRFIAPSRSFQYTVTLGGSTLTTRLQVHNRGQREFTFTGALHTYFTVPSIHEVELQGLAGLDYIDKTRAGGRFKQDEQLLVIRSEVDRVYINAPPALTIRAAQRPLLVLHKDATLPEAVVWNIWSEKVKSMADMAPDEYEKYVCVESGVINKSVTLAPGGRWQGGQTVSAGAGGASAL